MDMNAPKKLNLSALRRQYTGPHAIYNALREKDSMYFDTTSQSWLVTGYEPIATILSNDRFTSVLRTTVNNTSAHATLISKQMLFMDGEQHHRIRNIVSTQLAQVMKRMPEIIREVAHRSMQMILQARDVDFIEVFASPVSLLTIAHFLGIPTDDREMLTQLEQWSDAFADATTGYFRYSTQDITSLKDYFYRLIREKRHAPANDLISAFLAEEDIFPDEETLITNCIMVFTAGRTDTKRLLGNGITTIMQHWEQVQMEIKRDTRFIRPVSEELFRLVTPTHSVVRDVREDIDLSPSFVGEHFLHCGQRMLLYLEAANHDPVVFPQPEQFDPHRVANKKHLAFGYGPHRCPGAPLARLEIQIALEELFSLPPLCPKPGTHPVWNANPTLSGFISNPIICKYKV